MLHQKYPEVLNWGRYIDNISPSRRFVAYTWCHGPGHPQPQKKQKGIFQAPVTYPFLGPGHYKTPRNLPLNDTDEQSLLSLGACTRDGVYEFPRETRFTKEGIIKGLQQRTSNPHGPGKYTLPEPKYGAKGYTIPKAKETPDKIRARSVATAVPPPGTYEVKGMFDPSSDEEEDLAPSRASSAHGASRQSMSRHSRAS